jgi:putative phage-type endonuclease
VTLKEKLTASIEAHDRALFLGSSETAAILGISPWKTAYDVWESKQPGFVPEMPSEEKEKRFSRGKRLEPVILDQYQEESGAWITARNTRYFDEEFPFLTCEIDAEETDEQTGEITNLEVKSVAVFDAHNWGPPGTDEVPAYYAAQVMKNLLVSGRRKSKVVAWIGMDDMRVYLFERDEAVIATIREKEVNFWMNHVLTGVPPAIQSKDDALKMIAKLSGVTVQADFATLSAVERLTEVKAQQKEIEEECKALELKILTALATGTEGEPNKALLVDASGNQLASWNVQTRDGYTVKPTSFRVLRMKKQKESNHAR